MRATRFAHLFSLKLVILILWGESTKTEASHYVILPIFQLLLGMLKIAVNKFGSLELPARKGYTNTASRNKRPFQQE
jgi:hypothetical protein